LALTDRYGVARLDQLADRLFLFVKISLYRCGGLLATTILRLGLHHGIFDLRGLSGRGLTFDQELLGYMFGTNEFLLGTGGSCSSLW
jgi:hypothetical protein